MKNRNKVVRKPRKASKKQEIVVPVDTTPVEPPSVTAAPLGNGGHAHADR